MSIPYQVVTASIKGLTHVLCDINDTELVKVPNQGPLIIVSNHINFIEVPILYTHLQPRNITGFVKAETWNNPLMGYLFNLWDGIPIQRGEADTTAFRSALKALEQGKFLAIAPEGTRSGHGKLQRGFPGIIMVAHRSRVPILPIAYWGGEKIKGNLNQLKRTDFQIRVGKIFELNFPDGKLEHKIRDQMVNEIMYQLAILLPHEYRGHYADTSRLTTQYINFV